MSLRRECHILENSTGTGKRALFLKSLRRIGDTALQVLLHNEMKVRSRMRIIQFSNSIIQLFNDGNENKISKLASQAISWCINILN